MSQTFEQKRQATAQRLGIAPHCVPRHVAIIMDGNGRWAKSHSLPRFEGHQQGGKVVEEIALYCVTLGIEYLTLYSFSMQNWKRPKDEIDFLMYLYSHYLEGIRPNLMDDNVRLIHIGSKEMLPDSLLCTMKETVDMTKNNDGMVLGLALNYGSRAEITTAARKIAVKCKNGELDPDAIDEKCISDHLYTAGWCDPDLLIRTSGELRISNFLLWQISYAEFYVTDKHWPDFNKNDLDEAIKVYAQRSRRFGDIQSAQPS